MNWDELPGHPIALLGISRAKRGNSLWLLTTILQLYFYVKPLVQLLFFSKEKNEKLVISRKIPSSPPPSYFWPFYQTSKRCPKRAIFFLRQQQHCLKIYVRYAQCPKIGKIMQITARKGVHDSFQQNQPKPNILFYIPEKIQNEFWFYRLYAL